MEDLELFRRLMHEAERLSAVSISFVLHPSRPHTRVFAMPVGQRFPLGHFDSVVLHKALKSLLRAFDLPLQYRKPAGPVRLEGELALSLFGAPANITYVPQGPQLVVGLTRMLSDSEKTSLMSQQQKALEEFEDLGGEGRFY